MYEKRYPSQRSAKLSLLLGIKTLHSSEKYFHDRRFFPMSLYESGDSTGEISLAHLFEGPSSIIGHSKINLSELAYLICRRGWPGAICMDREIAKKDQQIIWVVYEEASKTTALCAGSCSLFYYPRVRQCPPAHQNGLASREMVRLGPPAHPKGLASRGMVRLGPPAHRICF